jgi:8-oxo-dGTP diphosphatase
MKANENQTKRRTGPLGVAVKGIIRQEGKYLLIRRAANSSFDPCLWDLPGGKLEYGEELAETLMREVKEETDLTITVGRPFATWHFFKGEVFVTGITFLCEFQGGELALSFEHSDFKWIEPDEYSRYPLSTALEPQLSSYKRSLKRKKP